ncbi:MAG TPA: HAD-IA family hydrolase [Pirellulaceae bacterium]|nr:HAD-IA family hydrolase [Pirellulaceae bacterium]
MASNFASVRAVVFDAVGTLIYPDPPAVVAYYGLGREHGSRLKEDDVARNFSRVLKRHAYEPRTSQQLERERWRRIVDDVFTDLDDTEALFRQLWDHFACAASWAVYEDVPEVFTQLSLLGLVIAIGSNFDNRLHAIAQQLSPLEQVREIFVSAQLGFTKPSIEFFRAIEAQLRRQPQQLLMIGDDLSNDIEGAAQSDWRTLHLNRDLGGPAPGTIRSLREIIPLFT